VSAVHLSLILLHFIVALSDWNLILPLLPWFSERLVNQAAVILGLHFRDVFILALNTSEFRTYSKKELLSFVIFEVPIGLCVYTVLVVI
jgi:hypothetical protein